MLFGPIKCQKKLSLNLYPLQALVSQKKTSFGWFFKTCWIFRPFQLLWQISCLHYVATRLLICNANSQINRLALAMGYWMRFYIKYFFAIFFLLGSPFGISNIQQSLFDGLQIRTLQLAFGGCWVSIFPWLCHNLSMGQGFLHPAFMGNCMTTSHTY